MKTSIIAFSLAAAGALSACGTAQTNENSVANSNRAAAPPASANQQATTPATNSAPPISPAHGGPAAPASSGNTAPTEQPGIDTATLDAQIEKAEAKAKAGGASDADKQAAAAAYVKRGNVFYDAGQPRLYKFALRDFNRALNYDPSNEEAQEKADMIVSIYKSMGRPVPIIE
ncbi:MAG: hypothetical protein M3371_05045 [Acidobacteriota bacterium]|nr:hypothetical protein [Acidobacteriota bacterium]